MRRLTTLGGSIVVPVQQTSVSSVSDAWFATFEAGPAVERSVNRCSATEQTQLLPRGLYEDEDDDVFG